MFIPSLLYIFRKFDNTLQADLAHSTNILLREACGEGIRFCTNILLREARGEGIRICYLSIWSLMFRKWIDSATRCHSFYLRPQITDALTKCRFLRPIREVFGLQNTDLDLSEDEMLLRKSPQNTSNGAEEIIPISIGTTWQMKLKQHNYCFKL